jgi:hypothetical protein
MITRFRTFLTCALLLAATLASGQTTPIQVVTKTVTKNLPYRPGYEVNMEGENARIVVESWEREEVKIVIELVAKHPQMDIARRDIDAMKFSIDQHGNKIYFRNYISPEEGQPQPEASLEAIYTVMLPDSCPVYAKNHFGNVTMSNLKHLVKIQSEFSKIFLDSIVGDLFVQSHFGDIFGRGIYGNVDIDARRSDITLRQIGGNFDISSHYGIIKLFADRSLLNLNIEAEKSDVYFFDPQPSAYGYTLTAHYGNITVPNDLKMNFLENTSNLQKAVLLPSNDMATISVRITFGDIIIRNP